ncbi:MAG: Uncharacterized protein XD50_0415 [Clostridia bacterium 41_269]|nr:MAG: Uncharacterized protein XD50_0415 [Clostridia bacterium 41_269]
MQHSKDQIDVAKSIRMIEWLKAELVSNVGSLLKSFVKGSEELMLDCLAAVIMTAYLLGKRSGIPFRHIDQRLKEKIAAGIKSQHEVEQWYGDLSSLERYMEERKR